MSNASLSSAAPDQDIPGLLLQPRELDRRWHWYLLRFLTFVGFKLFRWYFPLRIVGAENLARPGPFMMTLNHLSVMDIPTLGGALIEQGWHPGVNVFSIAKQELFQKRIMGWIAPRIGMFPVRRNQVDLNAMRTMLIILKRGWVLGIAPEGTRSPTGHLQLFQPGVAKIAIQKRLLLVPVGIAGVEQVMPIGSRFPRRVPITLRVGAPYELAEYYELDLTSKVLERAAWEMRARVAELLPEWMQALPPEDAEIRFGSVLSASEAKK